MAAEEQEALAKARDVQLFKLPNFPAPIVVSSQEVPARPAPTARQGSAGQQPQGPGQALPWRLPLPQFTGQEPLGTFLPLWAAQAVSGGGYTKPADSKCAFLLRPGEVSLCMLHLISQLASLAVGVAWSKSLHCHGRQGRQCGCGQSSGNVTRQRPARGIQNILLAILAILTG